MECLQANGYRLTNPRRITVEILANSKRPLNASEIYQLAKEQYAKIGLVSVYRTIEKLEELNLIQRVHKPEGCHAYIAGFTGHQHLLICTKCGKTEFFEGDDLQQLIARVSLESNFIIQDHWLTLFGICSDCQQKQSH
ncbi:MAG TPA: transcriptional repressor [Anaerolineae bacterium]|nr:transcriptional repressor [Anaerolineae bacterium]